MPSNAIATDEIPDEVKERDQWLYWNSSADKPRKPLATPAANYGAAWSDPDEWMSFEEVVEGASMVDAAGIGYVTAADNPDYPRGLYGVIDLDGCVDEDGRPKDWLPSLQPFFDHGAYMEFSPSGEGIHIPVAGIEVPDWWTDQHFSAEEHEGVEVLTHKFSTFTGDTLENCGSEVVDYGGWIDEWLAEAYQVITGDAPLEKAQRDPSSKELSFSDSSSENAGSGELTRDQVADALSHIDPDVDYATWRNIGFALQDHFTDSTALQLFTQWSRKGRKWDDQAERQAERIVRDASSGGGCTIGTVVHHAKRGGWSPPKRSNWFDTDFQEAVREETEDESELSDGDIWEIWSEERLHGRLDENSIIPQPALRHIARDRELYGFDALPDDVDDLPVKAHNRALWWVKERWAEEHGLEEATACPYKERDPEAVFTWEDVRYIYEESKSDGRYASVQLLRSKYYFLVPEDTEELRIYNDDLGLYERGAEYDIGRELDRNLGSHYSQHEKNEIIGRLRESVVERDQLEAADHDDNLICVENGVLNVDKRELYDHDPAYKFTHGLPVQYDSDAECEEIDSFLDEITRREEDKKTLLEVLGNCLLPNYDYPYVLFLFGEGSNGKSTWLDTVRAFLGDENTSSVPLHQLAENRFATARLVGKWANIAADLPAKKLEHTGTLKNLSGGDAVPAEKKGKDGFDFENRAKLMFAANRPPVIAERTRAIKRRLVPIHLPYEFTDGDDGDKDRVRGLSEKLTADEELSGLLNAALDGLDRLKENDDVSLPETVDERLELYERHSDHIKAFRIDCLTNENGKRVSKDDVYNAYTNYCDDRDREPVAKSTFWKMLRKTTLDVTVRRVEDANGDRVRVLDNATFTDQAAEYAPGRTLTEEEPEEPDKGESNTGLSSEATAIEDLDTSDRYATVTVEVVRWEPTGDGVVAAGGPAESGTVRDVTGPVDIVDFFGGGHEGLPLEEEKTYRLENVRVDRYDGALQLEIVKNLTEVAEVQPGVGYAPQTDPDSETDAESTQQTGLDSATTDGGEKAVEKSRDPEGDSLPPADAVGPKPDAQRLRQVLEEKGRLSKADLTGRAVERFDMDPDRVGTALEYGQKNGWITDVGGGEFKAV